MKKRDAYSEFMALTPAQREAATKEFDREMIADTFGPLSAAQKKLWAKAVRKRGRPRVGAGAKVVSVTIEKRLLLAADKRARALGISRAQLIARGLQTVLGSRPRRAA